MTSLLRLSLSAAIVSLSCLVACPQVATAAAAADSHDSHDDHGGHGLGHQGASEDPGEVKTDLAIFTAAVFLLLVIILRKFAWKPIAAGLEKREHHIAHEIAAAEKANHDAQHLLADYKQKLDAAHAEVRAILEEARRDAEHTKQLTISEARAEAQIEAARGKREIEAAKDVAMRELAEVAADQALALAGKLLQQKLQPADHARLIEEALAKFPAPSRN
ncbi:MAG: F0F1 ATP synthase subunit B [Pirellulales bacterium]